MAVPHCMAKTTAYNSQLASDVEKEQLTSPNRSGNEKQFSESHHKSRILIFSKCYTNMFV
jgi:hypothetical protein